MDNQILIRKSTELKNKANLKVILIFMQLDLLDCQDFHKYILPKMSELPANQIFPRENLNIKVQIVADSQHSDTFFATTGFSSKVFWTYLSLPTLWILRLQIVLFSKIFNLPLHESILTGRWRCICLYHFTATSSGKKLYDSVLLFWSEKKFYQVHTFPQKNPKWI